MKVKLECFKSAMAFFFLFFLHRFSIGNGQQGISYNVLRLGEGCLTDAQFSLGISMAAFAKPLLCAGRVISIKFNLKTKCCQKTKQTN